MNLKRLALPALILGSTALGSILANQALQSSQATGGPAAWPPASWSVGAWWIDRSNSTTCASDTACNGQSATCAGSGACPFRTFNHLLNQVWQCFGNPAACPRLRQNTTITFLGPGESGGTNTDPLYARWTSENGAQVTVTGTATVVQSGTFTASTAKNVTTGQLLNVTLASGTGAAVGALLVNSTRSNSHATLAQLVSGNNWVVTQPQSTPTIPPSQNPTENNAWTTGDSYTLSTLTNVNVVTVDTPTIDINGAFTSVTTFETMNIYDPAGAGSDNIVIDPTFVTFQDVNFQRTLVVRAPIESSVGVTSYINSLILGGHFAAIGAAPAYWFGGGIVGSAAYQETFPSVQFINDIILNPGGTSFVAVEGFVSALSSAYIGSSKSLIYYGGTVSFPAHASNIWGPGIFSGFYNARISIPTASDGGAALAFLNEGGLQLNSIFVPNATIDAVLNTGVTKCYQAVDGGATSSATVCNMQ